MNRSRSAVSIGGRKGRRRGGGMNRSESAGAGLAAMGQMVNKVAGEGGAMLGTVTGLYDQLERDIRDDEEAIKEYKRILAGKLLQREKLAAVVQSRQEFCDSLQDGGSLGGVMKDFANIEKFVKKEYVKARQGHQAGMDMLKKEFGYNQAYKKGNFTGTWFTPCKDPAKRLDP